MAPLTGLLSRWRRAWAAGASPWVGLRDGPRVGALGATDVPGVHVVGDLGDSPLLKGALTDGWRVGQHLADELDVAPDAPGDRVDVVVIGAGPAGCAAGLALRARGRSVVVLERDRPFTTLAAFPRGKKLLATPRALDVEGPLRFDDTTSDALVARWRERVAAEGLPIHEGVEVNGVDGRADALVVRATRRLPDGATLDEEVRARRVVVAVGRRATPRRLDVPGASLPHVHDHLEDAAALAGRRVLVAGGGDSAAEAAVQLGEAGAHVVWAVRSPSLRRPREANRARVRAAVEAGAVTLRTGTTITAITPTHATLRGPDGATDEVRADVVLPLLGADPPLGLLRRLGVRLRSDRAARDTLGVLAFAAFVWCFYVLKSGRRWFPFHDGGGERVHELLAVHAPWWPGGGRTLDAGFWGTVVYSLAILGFGVAALRRRDTPEQRRRYASLIGFQWVFLFGVPEVLAPAITSVSGALYAVSVPWPLRIESLAMGPEAAVWVAVGALTSFVAIPAFVRRHNERFCSWMCGCGGLAETVGDLWRWRAPRGDLARQAEGAGRVVLLAAIPVTALVLADAWELVARDVWMDQALTVADGEVRVSPPTSPARVGSIRVASATLDGRALTVSLDKLEPDGAWRPIGWTSGMEVDGAPRWPERIAEGTYRLELPADRAAVRALATSSPLSRPREFARAWYGLMVDFLLASVVGVALYPLLGNRVWCRFFCPLRAWMEWLAARYGRLAIVADDTCISCGECTRWCQMGIDVQGFSEARATLDNRNSACIQCGVCVQVCPMGTLSLVDRLDRGLPPGDPHPEGPRWGA